MKIHTVASILFAVGLLGLFLETIILGLALTFGWAVYWPRIAGNYILLLALAIASSGIMRAFDTARKP